MLKSFAAYFPFWVLNENTPKWWWFVLKMHEIIQACKSLILNRIYSLQIKSFKLFFSKSWNEQLNNWIFTVLLLFFLYGRRVSSFLNRCTVRGGSSLNSCRLCLSCPLQGASYSRIYKLQHDIHSIKKCMIYKAHDSTVVKMSSRRSCNLNVWVWKSTI